MTEPLITHLVTFKPADPTEKLRDSIGGYPYLPKGLDYPACSCGERMSLYFQFDIREEFGLPYESGSHLAVFMCEACNQLTDRLHGPVKKSRNQLRKNYWDFNGTRWKAGWTKFYRLMLVKPGGEFEFLPAEEFIRPCSLDFVKTEEHWTTDENAEEEATEPRAEPGLPGTSVNWSMGHYGSRQFKVGGQPAWGGDGDPPENLLCACGAPMAFVCYVPSELVFPNDRTTVYTYKHIGSLFSGLSVYILACRDQCHPFAVYPVTQP
jgi:hypothetical protein